MVMLGRSGGMQLNDLLGRLGMPGGFIGAQADMLSGNSLGVLKNLRDGYNETALGRGTTRFERIIGRGGMMRRMGGMGIPPFGAMASPGRMLPIMGPMAGGGYSGGFQRIDMAAGSSNNFMSRMFNPRRRAGVKLERLLKRNPSARAAFESAIGGRIVGFGRNDGRMTIQRFAPGFQPIPGFAQNPMANHALGSMHGMQHSVLGQAGKLGLLGAGLGGAMGALGGLLSGGMMGNPFGGLMMGGLGGLLSGGMMGGDPLSLDAWRGHYFTDEEAGDPGIGAPDADPDGDGHSNEQEFLAGTDPTDVASVLRILSLARAGSGALELRWAGVAGRRYVVERTSDLRHGFGAVTGDIAGTPPENVLTLTLGEAPAGFYRVRLAQ